MPEQIFFQCSLPRTGSTLFQNIMNQNPQFYASASNGMLDMLDAATKVYFHSPEYSAQNHATAIKGFCGFTNAAISGYYKAITDKRYVIDKSKGRFADYRGVAGFYSRPKIICFVRDMVDIVASMERLFKKNEHKDNDQIKPLKKISQGERNITWANQFLHETKNLESSIKDGNDTKMLFVKYEDFCRNPKHEIERVYDYLDVPYFRHDFNNVQQTVEENEEVYGYTGMLKISPEVKINTEDAKNSIDDLAKTWIDENFRWYNDYFGYDQKK